MNTVHTPGPWNVRRESVDPEWAIVCASNGRIVANVSAETGPDLPPMVSLKMPRDANAILIAASPNMLKTLHEIREALIDARKNMGCTSENCSGTCHFCANIRRADASIREATKGNEQ